MEDYVLDHRVTGQNEKNVSCLTLLLTWDRSDNGRARSFHRLSLRLSQIGRRDLSDKLAQLVYDEKTDEVRFHSGSSTCLFAHQEGSAVALGQRCTQAASGVPFPSFGSIQVPTARTLHYLSIC